MNWLVYTIISGLFIGCSFFFRKMATKSTNSLAGFIVEGLVYGVIILAFFAFQKNKATLFANPLYPTLSAVTLFFGAMFLYRALAAGKLTLVNVIYVALSLVTAIILSLIFLKEQLELKQIIALILGIVAIILLRI